MHELEGKGGKTKVRITWRNKKAPHQIDLRFETSTGDIISGCNCGVIFDKARLINAHDVIQDFRLHMQEVLSLKGKLNHRGR